MIQLRRHGTTIRALVLALIAAVLIPLPATAHPGHGDETFNALIFSKTRAAPRSRRRRGTPRTPIHSSPRLPAVPRTGSTKE